MCWPCSNESRKSLVGSVTSCDNSTFIFASSHHQELELRLAMSKFAPHSGRFSQPKATSSTVCQRCLERGKKCLWFCYVFLFQLDHLHLGHYTYECKNSRPYVSRPSRTQQLENPNVREKMKTTIEVPEEFKTKPCVMSRRTPGTK